MPPKKKDAPSKKNETKKKEKVIEDRTFGLKNKKGGKQQKFIQQVTKQVQSGGLHPKKTPAELELIKKKEELDKKKREQDDIDKLFRPVQSVAKGTDPKSVLCAFFKAGSCGKGAKCKFSHDLAIERKGAKRSMYDGAETEKKDLMEDWDEAKLAEVVNKKHGDANIGLPTTAIICKFFLDALELNKYGWFWQCPSGDNCHYRHALPPGFVLKKDKKAMEANKVTITLEELVEKERAALGGNLIKVTLETFIQWKKKKRLQKVEKAQTKLNKKKSDFKSGKAFGVSGREMFEFNPELADGDDDEAEEGAMEREVIEGEEEDTSPIVELDLESLAKQASESTGGGRTAAKGAASPAETASSGGDANATAAATKSPPSLKGASAAVSSASEADKTAAAIKAAESAIANGTGGAVGGVDIDIDENLFDDDLDELDEDLETLEL